MHDMVHIAGYHIIQTLYESNSSIVFRARRESDEQPVIIKVLRQPYPTPARIDRFKREYGIVQALNLPGVVAAYDMEVDQHRWMMVLEDIGGESLTRLGMAGSPNLLETLRLAIQVADSLGQIHQQYVIHRDINPANIVFNPTTGQLRIIDFSIAVSVTPEQPTFRTTNMLEGTLAYMSPEQTGRMSRMSDYRTDFYSLGVTLYELFTGQVPFPTTDDLELIHCHIARYPPTPHEVRPTIPRMLSNIVLKLMSKNAEERYQSAYGLRVDLEECLRQWQATGYVHLFTTGQYDHADRFYIPRKLYGRALETEMLLQSFQRISRGACELIAVSGSIGIGKSALVQELHEPITRQRGFFLSGKFDQFQRTTPYSALIQAFRSLMRQLLMASDADIAIWRERLLAACGSQGQVIIDVIPEVQLIIGPQQPVVALGPTESRHRFNLVFQHFIKVFAQPDHPLVLFLDDIQWADGASLRLVRRLINAQDCNYVLVLMAYREDDAGGQYLLQSVLDTLHQIAVPMQHIALQPLQIPDVTQLVAETLQCALRQARPLAELVTAKTGGNPFFLKAFLTSLHDKGLITFDDTSRCWCWDIEQIQSHQMTDNVVELMANKVQQFASPTRHALKLAACIGSQFDLVTLAVVLEKTTGETARDLEPVVNEGLIVPPRDTYTLIVLDEDGQEDEVPAEYVFAHDRIQQAVYSLILEQEKPTVHWQIGQLLLWSMPPEEREERIFDIVYQLNKGQVFIVEQEGRDELAQFNLVACKRAKVTAAYESAFNYAQRGLEMLSADSWQRQYNLTLSLHQEAAEAAMQVGHVEEMESLVETALQQVMSLADMMPFYEVQVLSYKTQNNLQAAIQTALRALLLCGITLPEQPDQDDVARVLATAHMYMQHMNSDALHLLHHMKDPCQQATMRLLLHLSSAVRDSRPNLFTVLVGQQIILSATRGHSSLSAFAYANYGAVLCCTADTIDAGYRAGQFALTLLEQFDTTTFKAHTRSIVHAFVRSWKEHLKETIEPLHAAYRHGLDTGDIDCAALAAHSVCALSYLLGKELTSLERDMIAYHDILSQHNQTTMLDMHCVYHQAVLNLLNRNDVPDQLIGDTYNEVQMLPRHLAAQESVVLYVVFVHKLMLCYMFGQYEQAVRHADAAAAHQPGVVGALLLPFQLCYDSLARLALLPDAEAPEQERLLAHVAANQRHLEHLAQIAPMNHQHKFSLVEAEQARVTGHMGQAWEHYQHAIRLAEEHGYLQEEALAYELAARFHLVQGLSQVASVYLQDAYYAYLRWGAVAKAKDLEACYPHFLAQAFTSAQASMPQEASNQTVRRTSSAFDLTSVVKASQAISEDIVLDTLLAKLINIVIENAGAERGVLLLPKHEQWVIEAEGAINQDGVTVLQATPAEAPQTADHLPLSVINYVRHTQQTVVVHDSASADQFGDDPYVALHKPRSMLCAPLLNQGALIGIIYLENRLTAGVFTPDRLEVLNLLSAQATISIEKAKLYTTLQAALEQQVTLTKAYSRFVPREILQFLGKDSITQVRLGDQTERDMTIMFSDIRAFTSLSEQMTPQENFNFINSYLSRIGPIIREYNGFIDKYIGDAVMALFPEQASDAVKAAIHMQKEVRLYNEHRANQHYQPITIGIGLHTGRVMLGTVGELERMEGTVISDTVNLASRLEGLNKLYGASIIISEHTLNSMQEASAYQVRFLGAVRVKGKQDAVNIFEVLDGNPQTVVATRVQTRADFETGLRCYYNQQFHQAVAHFDNVLSVDPADRVARLYLQRANHCIEYGVPVGWDGVEIFSEKRSR